MAAIDHISDLGSYVVPGLAIGLLTVGAVPGAICGALLYLTDKTVNVSVLDIVPNYLSLKEEKQNQVDKVASICSGVASKLFTMSLAVALKVTAAPLFSFSLGIAVGGIKAVQYLTEKATGKKLSSILKSGLRKACSYVPCSSSISSSRGQTYKRGDYLDDMRVS